LGGIGHCQHTQHQESFVLPDSRRPLRRVTTSRSLKRAFTHFVVIGLVAFSAAFGIAATQGTLPSGDDTNGAFDLVSRVRGAAAAEEQLRSSSFQLQPDPLASDQLPRSVVRVVPTPEPTPLPTPVPPPPPPDPTPAPVVAARPASNGMLAWPVGGTITSYFSASHLAIDIAADAGVTVLAADGGVVTWAGWRNNGGGYVVSIDHGNGITTVYNHLGSLLVSAGQAVSRGQGIATVGCTGTCTGPHVHFEVIVGGVHVNPLRYL
jgi:murein DD-endopeptidase MepM/ murein hydrolase activator NlpD